ncbi:cytidine deaminase [Miniphocaeibacter massiliensis]|uniref:cytidine deaminase n=1 Tax=Miniphocaeibacter massiliensis TaxID=2041841 RepID=UPI000C08CF78|nr:cytidine deaminase [Miniphocaeibacter massiliensis]
MNNSELIEIAIDARKNSYAPYSNFNVGAVVVTDTNEVYTGCNIENAAYSPSVCAERTAIFKAISEGASKIRKIIVVGSEDFTFPCGVCRQVIKEFASEDCEIIVVNSKKEYKIYLLKELLPNSFGPENLRRKNV